MKLKGTCDKIRMFFFYLLTSLTTFPQRVTIESLFYVMEETQ